MFYVAYLLLSGAIAVVQRREGFYPTRIDMVFQNLAEGLLFLLESDGAAGELLPDYGRGAFGVTAV
jgi:hypothetical protein